MHVPQNRPVFLHLESADVIHSCWLPRLAGKTDVIPNRTNHMWFEPTRADIFIGQCAEYCGTQHANMMLRVIVDPQDPQDPQDPSGKYKNTKYDDWLEGQKRDAVDSPSTQAGKDFFLTKTCVSCHTIQGTIARGTFGPDLTHLKSRQTLASGMIPNTSDAWPPGCAIRAARKGSSPAA